ncbi:MAG: hypothetical protein M1436_02035 [Acidobacteria bacterium]|nr:hypothetical protein [Acidobacteriota bacterium]
MTKRAGWALFLAMAVLFLIANRAAYQGYFQDDEIDNLSWAPHVPNMEYAEGLLTPKPFLYNFRPVGHFYFAAMGRTFGLDFPKYLIAVHLLHFLNVWLLWLIARRLRASPFAAGAAALFFAFHMAVFDVYWKPMYVFDVLCTTFCLLSLWLFMGRRWVLSFAAFWLALKSKEIAVMLPAVLLCYEYWLGKRQWKPLVPFFLASASFGLQGVLFNPNQDNEYTFRFTADALRKTAGFYSSKLLLVPYAGFALALLLLVRDRRIWFGLASMVLFFVPLLFLPGRLFAAYCYLPLTGMAVALSALADQSPRALAAGFFLLWLPWNLYQLRLNRRQALTVAAENRAYISGVGELARFSPDTRTFIYDGAPSKFHPWGIEGALKYFYQVSDVTVRNLKESGATQLLRGNSFAILSWDESARKLTTVARRPDTPDASYIRMDNTEPLWQLDDGWYPRENRFRWTKPDAAAHLFRPREARQFEVVMVVSPEEIRDAGAAEIRATINGRVMGARKFTKDGLQVARWDLPSFEDGSEKAGIALHFEPAYHPGSQDPRTLGGAIVSFGFVQ